MKKNIAYLMLFVFILSNFGCTDEILKEDSVYILKRINQN